MANLTPTEMVACDQLFKAALQQCNTNINDKLVELRGVVCVKYGTMTENISCDDCMYKDTCVSKSRVEDLKSDLSDLTDERVNMMNKYSELQDKIKDYLLS